MYRCCVEINKQLYSNGIIYKLQWIGGGCWVRRVFIWSCQFYINVKFCGKKFEFEEGIFGYILYDFCGRWKVFGVIERCFIEFIEF